MGTNHEQLAEAIASIVNIKILEVYRKAEISHAREIDKHLTDLGTRIVGALELPLILHGLVADEETAIHDTQEPPGAADEPADPDESQTPSTGGELDTGTVVKELRFKVNGHIAPATLAERINAYIEEQDRTIAQAARDFDIAEATLGSLLAGGNPIERTVNRITQALERAGY